MVVCRSNVSGDSLCQALAGLRWLSAASCMHADSMRTPLCRLPLQQELWVRICPALHSTQTAQSAKLFPNRTCCSCRVWLRVRDAAAGREQCQHQRQHPSGTSPRPAHACPLHGLLMLSGWHGPCTAKNHAALPCVAVVGNGASRSSGGTHARWHVAAVASFFVAVQLPRKQYHSRWSTLASVSQGG